MKGNLVPRARWLNTSVTIRGKVVLGDLNGAPTTTSLCITFDVALVRTV